MQLAFSWMIFLLSGAVAQTNSIPSVSTITALATVPKSGVPGALIGSEYIPELGTCQYYFVNN
jgi:hypothetical protein